MDKITITIEFGNINDAREFLGGLKQKPRGKRPLELDEWSSQFVKDLRLFNLDRLLPTRIEHVLTRAANGIVNYYSDTETKIPLEPNRYRVGFSDLPLPLPDFTRVIRGVAYGQYRVRGLGDKSKLSIARAISRNNADES